MLPQLSGIFRFNSTTVANKVSIALQELDSFLCVRGYIVVLILMSKDTKENY